VGHGLWSVTASASPALCKLLADVGRLLTGSRLLEVRVCVVQASTGDGCVVLTLDLSAMPTLSLETFTQSRTLRLSPQERRLLVAFAVERDGSDWLDRPDAFSLSALFDDIESIPPPLRSVFHGPPSSAMQCQRASALLMLPNDVLHVMTGFLDARSLAATELTCSALRYAGMYAGSLPGCVQA
jgi:hypothetical protein